MDFFSSLVTYLPASWNYPNLSTAFLFILKIDFIFSSFIKKVQPVLMNVEMKEDAGSNPGPSSRSSSMDSDIKSIGSVTESVENSVEDLSNVDTQNNTPIDCDDLEMNSILELVTDLYFLLMM
ncbi:uncharacterized protein LOC143208535 [Lasioglossum baleicum]|uniref:uncharacterized protein LOC143208535 n=1 Tax=Lasioglossum baleicum TaxID=434251 RepID=UPI003FCE9072